MFSSTHMKKRIQNFVSTLCEPTFKTGSDSIEHVLISRQNKTLFWIFLAICTCLPSILFLIGVPFNHCWRVQAVHLVNLTLFLSLCRSYLWAYHILFIIVNALFPFIFVNVAFEFAYLQIGHALIFPMLVLLLTNRICYGSFISAIHFLVALLKTKEILRQNLLLMDPSVFIDRIVHSGLSVSLAAFIIFGITLHRLNKRTREVMLASRISEETIEKQKTFLFSFSHEMRNPLNSLLGNLELTLMEKLPLKVEEMIKTAQICAEVLLQQINNILDSGKQDIGNLEVHLTQVEVEKMFQRIWALSGELIKRKHLKGAFKIDKNLPSILLLDAHRVNQVMMNLIGNAIKFTERGSLTVSVNWYEDMVMSDEIFEPIPYDDENEGIFEKNECVHLLQQRDSDRRDYYLLDEKKTLNEYYSAKDAKGILRIIISDTGSGMTVESMKQLFQKFSQVSSDPNKRKIGTGLGLFITKEICTRMEADIRVYSKLGTGTTFIICIPTMSISVKPELQRQRRRSSMFEAIALQNLHCLVADDSPLNVAMVCNYFEKIGIKSVDTVGNGQDAVNLYKQNRLAAGKVVDVVTLDIDMPKMDGKTACQKIREFERANKLSPAIIILISGNYEEEQIDLGNGSDKKADCFLKKPLKFEEFSSTVFRLLDSKFSPTPLVMNSL